MSHESLRIGVDLGGTKIEAAALDPAGEVVARRRVATPAHEYEAILRAIGALVRDIELETNRRATVGVGIPGAISPRAKLVKNSFNTGLNGHPLDVDLARVLDRPVRIENDANCFALSEATDGAGAGGRIVFGVILGSGVGGGLVVDGEVVEGCNRIAGEWGHNPLPWPRLDEFPGPPCYCGHDGCVETFLSGPALARDYLARSERALDGAQIAALGDRGDATALATLFAYQDRLGRALASVVNLVDPDVIVLGGGVSNIDRLYDGLDKIVEKHAFSDAIDTKILRNMHGDSSGVRGAAWLWGAG